MEIDGVGKERQSEVDGCLKKQQDLPPKTATEHKDGGRTISGGLYSDLHSEIIREITKHAFVVLSDLPVFEFLQ